MFSLCETKSIAELSIVGFLDFFNRFGESLTLATAICQFEGPNAAKFPLH